MLGMRSPAATRRRGVCLTLIWLCIANKVIHLARLIE